MEGKESNMIKALNAVRKHPICTFDLEKIMDALMDACIEQHTASTINNDGTAVTVTYYTKNRGCNATRIEANIRTWMRKLLHVVSGIKRMASPCRHVGMAWMMRLPYIGRLAFVGCYIL